MNLVALMPAFHSTRAGFSALCMVCAAGCAPSYPSMATSARGDAAFKERIATAHPPGTPAAHLRAKLAGDGFTLIEERATRRFSAIEAPTNLPCFSTTRIDWTEDARGRIGQIQAARHACS